MDDFGGKLRQARERRGISLRQIAASTKISAAALEALERNDISKLPGSIFSRAFVRSYAVEVGLDPDETVAEFLARFNQEAPPTAESAGANVPEAELEFESRRRTAARVLKIALVALPVAAVLAYFAWKGRVAARQAEQEMFNTPAPIAAPEPPPAVAIVPAPAADTGAPGAVRDATLTLELHPTADCWVSLTIDGRKLFARVIPAGERQSHPVTREAVVEVGDAGAFAFALNGREGKSLGDKGQVKTLRLTPATASQYLR
jgi:cytoskeleton protein RodZ